jgi:hypothetical protein
MFVSMVPLATAASAQQPAVVGEQITLRGTVEGLDQTARTVTIRGERGNVVTVDMPMVGSPALQLGDVVSVAYYDRVSVRLKPAGEAPVDRAEAPVTTATPGGLPEATVVSQRITTVTITGWDPTQRVVTFTGPGGTAYTRRLVDTTDAQIMAGIKVGDRVDVTRTEAVRIAVEQRTQVTVNATEAFLNRLTVAVLWGWDNQFTGDMIHNATGQTTTGVPINLSDTSYDDVYGRMAILKIGVGYRLTPRTEAVINFVWSESAAEQTRIGTAGAANVPLTVNFSDYSYWGFEGGHRAFFARTRFTPYVGYLIGINRFGDITGTFENVPANVTPGLTAQDGKFFEKSWAFSLGPTGGFLVGIGPVEFMLESQLRWMGGLSDVDWLVEEGLKDINEESSRWSYPVQFGVRIRF